MTTSTLILIALIILTAVFYFASYPLYFLIAGILLVIVIFLKIIGLRIIGNGEVGIVEKLWSTKGSLENKIIALHGEAGYQPGVLRGGLHIVPGYQYVVHKVNLVTIHRGRIGYVFARDGQPLGTHTVGASTTFESGQTLGRVVANGEFTDVREFMEAGGQQGRQRAILREGTYAINLSQFTVISGIDQIHYLALGDKNEAITIKNLAAQIESEHGFSPIVIDGSADKIGIVTVHEVPHSRRATSSRPLWVTQKAIHIITTISKTPKRSSQRAAIVAASIMC